MKKFLFILPVIFCIAALGQQSGMTPVQIAERNKPGTVMIQSTFKGTVSAITPVVDENALGVAIRTGDITDYSDSDIAAFMRKKLSDEVLILANTRNSAQTFSVPQSLQTSQWKNAADNSGLQLGSTVTLDAFQYLILVK